jgi:hypothetical protein
LSLFDTFSYFELLSHYFEVVASSSSGLRIQLNAKMLDTVLVDTVSSNVLNEVQEIEISSDIIKESFVSFSFWDSIKKYSSF